MKCIKCGAEIDNNALSCDKCSLVFTEEMKASMIAYENQMAEYNRQMEEYNRKMAEYNNQVETAQADEQSTRPIEFGADEQSTRPIEFGADEQSTRPIEFGADEQSTRPIEHGVDEQIGQPVEMPGMPQPVEGSGMPQMAGGSGMPQMAGGSGMPQMAGYYKAESKPVPSGMAGYSYANSDVQRRVAASNKKGIPNFITMLGVILAIVATFLPYAMQGDTSRSLWSVFGKGNIYDLLMVIGLMALALIAFVLCFFNNTACKVINFICSCGVASALIFEFVLTIIDKKDLANASLAYGSIMSVVAAGLLIIAVPIWSIIFRKK